jgi:hypothetical protein
LFEKKRSNLAVVVSLLLNPPLESVAHEPNPREDKEIQIIRMNNNGKRPSSYDNDNDNTFSSDSEDQYDNEEFLRLLNAYNKRMKLKHSQGGGASSASSASASSSSSSDPPQQHGALIHRKTTTIVEETFQPPPSMVDVPVGTVVGIVDHNADNDAEEQAPQRNAFDVMMNRATNQQKTLEDEVKNMNVIGIIYESKLVGISSNDPLYGISYIGQSIRPANLMSTQKVLADRIKKHLSDANNKKFLINDVGFHAAINKYLPDAFEWKIVASNFGKRINVAKWANDLECELIEQRGGILKSMNHKQMQTLNKKKGGQDHFSYASISNVAKRQILFEQFIDELQCYVDKQGTSYVPALYVNEHTGYKLGMKLCDVRQGRLWKSMPNETELKTTLESFPGWTWNCKQSSQYKQTKSHERKKWWASLTEEQRDKRREKNIEVQARPEVKKRQSEARTQFYKKNPEERTAQSERAKQQAAAEPEGYRSERKKKQMANMTKDDREKWKKKISATKSTLEARAAQSTRSLTQWNLMSQDTKNKRSQNISKALSRPEAKKRASSFRTQFYKDHPEERDAQRERVKQHLASHPEHEQAWRDGQKLYLDDRLRKEIQTARAEAVPFNKSKKERAELQKQKAAEGKKLYMKHTDEHGNQTIRRVDKQGIMRERDIVCAIAVADSDEEE